MQIRLVTGRNFYAMLAESWRTDRLNLFNRSFWTWRRSWPTGPLRRLPLSWRPSDRHTRLITTLRLANAVQYRLFYHRLERTESTDPVAAIDAQDRRVIGMCLGK